MSRFEFLSGEGAISKINQFGGLHLPPLDRPPATPSFPGPITGPTAAVSGGGTVLGATIPVIYGEATVPGYLCFVERDDEYLYAMWVICSGRVVTPVIGDVTLNGELLANVGGVDSFVAKPGSITQTSIPNITWTALGTAYKYEYPGQVLVGCRLKTTAVDAPSNLNLRCTIGGRYCYDTRTSSEVVTTNPVVIAYDIMTSSWPWPGVLSSTDIDEDQWETWADWCDATTNIGPSKITLTSGKRWEFNGAVRITNPWEAANAVLAGAFLSIVEVNGTFMLRPECDVTPLSISIPLGRTLGPISISESDPRTIPTEMQVGFTAGVDNSECNVIYRRSAATGEYVKVTSKLFGCILQEQAYRWAEQSAKLYAERWNVKIPAGPEVANVAPGDIIEAELPYGFGTCNIRVMRIYTKMQKGMYEISGRIVPGDVESSTELSAYSASTADGGWGTGQPNTPDTFTVTVASYNTSRDTVAPLINAVWTPPVDGPRVMYYEITMYPGAVIIARVAGNRWSGPIIDTSTSAYFNLHAVGYDGTACATPKRYPTSGFLNTDRGHVGGLMTTPLEGTITEELGFYLYDDTAGQLKAVVEEQTHEGVTDQIDDGDSAVVVSSPSSSTVIAASVTAKTGTEAVWISNIGSTAVTVSRTGTSGDLPIFVILRVTADIDRYGGATTSTPTES